MIPGNPHLEYLKALRKDSRQYSATDLLQSLVLLLERAAAVYEAVYLIVDGLDECGDRRPLINSLLSLTTRKINLLITSRPEQDIEKAFHGKPFVRMDINGIREDIVKHVNWKLNKDDSFPNFGEGLKCEIQARLTEKHAGMYGPQ